MCFAALRVRALLASGAHEGYPDVHTDTVASDDPPATLCRVLCRRTAQEVLINGTAGEARMPEFGRPRTDSGPPPERGDGLLENVTTSCLASASSPCFITPPETHISTDNRGVSLRTQGLLLSHRSQRV